MKKFLIGATIFFITLFLVIIFNGCNKSRQEKVATGPEVQVQETQVQKPALKKELTKEEKEVRQLILQHASVMQMQNLTKRDQARRSLYAQDYTYTGPDGRFFTKNELLARQKNNRLKVRTVEIKKIQVQTYGQTAVANYQAKVVGSQRGLPYTSLKTSVTSVLVKQDGKWQIVTDHLTLVSS